MKKLIILSSITFALLTSCSGDPGESELRLDGTESNLPDELKGLRIYEVSTGMSSVKVAILNDTVNSLTYRVGKHDETTIIVNPTQNSREITGEIISETDSIIVIKKI